MLEPRDVAAALATLLAVNALLAVTATRVVHFAGGQAVIEQRGASEHVVIRWSSGREFISDCDASSGGYDQVVQFARAVKSAAQRNDPHALATMIMYPLRVNTAPNKGYIVSSKEALLAQFNRVFTADEMRRLKRLEPNDVFCRDGMSMLADGAMWVQVSHDGTLRAVVVNNGR